MVQRVAEAAEASPATGSKGLSILVAEDNDINALLTRASPRSPRASPRCSPGSLIGQRLQATEQPLSNPGWPRVRQAPLTTWFSWMCGCRKWTAWKRHGESVWRKRSSAMLEPTCLRSAVLSAGLDGLLIKPLDRERLREALSTASARAFDPLAA
jgi:hypothetical protein